MLVSFALALMVGTAVLLAVAIVVLGPLLWGSTSTLTAVGLFLLRWALALALLLLAVGVLLRFGPECHQPLHWVSFGTLLIAGGWVVMSAGFGFYLRDIASYNSVFGGLATIVVLIAYLYGAALVFLGGAQVDALVRGD
jgi:membrane protein